MKTPYDSQTIVTVGHTVFYIMDISKNACAKEW